MTQLPDWARESIEWHRRNGTLATPQPGAAYDAALAKDQTMPSNMLPSSGAPRGRTGRDQAPPASPMSSAGAFTQNLDQVEGGTPIDCDLLMHFVEICLNKLDGDERDKFVGALHSLLSSSVYNVLAPPVRRNGNGSDRRLRSGNRSIGRDRRPAQDAAMRSHVAIVNREYGFFQRFPEARNIKFSASGRY
jgi:hypothetical protein